MTAPATEPYLGSTPRITVGERELVVDLSVYADVDKHVPRSVTFTVTPTGVLILPSGYHGPLTFVKKEPHAARRSKDKNTGVWRESKSGNRNKHHPLVKYVVRKSLPFREESEPRSEPGLSRKARERAHWDSRLKVHRQELVSQFIHHRGLNKMWNACWRRLLVWLDPVALKLAREIRPENPLPFYNLLCARPDLRDVVGQCKPLGFYVDAKWPKVHTLDEALRHAKLPGSGAFRDWATRVRFWPLFTPLKHLDTHFVNTFIEGLEDAEPEALAKVRKPIHWRLLAIASYHQPDLIPGLLEEPDLDLVLNYFRETSESWYEEFRVAGKTKTGMIRDGLRRIRTRPNDVKNFSALYSRVLQLCITDKLVGTAPDWADDVF